MSLRFLERWTCCLWDNTLRCSELGFGQVLFKRLVAPGRSVAEAGGQGSLQFREDIGVEGAFEALTLGEISMEMNGDGEGRGPKTELVDSPSLAN